MFIIKKYNNYENFVNKKIDQLFTETSFNYLVTDILNRHFLFNVPIHKDDFALTDDITDNNLKTHLKVLEHFNGGDISHTVTIQTTNRLGVEQELIYIVITYYPYDSLNGIDLLTLTNN